jgi:hypothetical protein
MMEETKQLQEANLEQDAVKSVKARNIIEYIQEQVKNYEKNTNVIRVYQNGHLEEVKISFEDFQVYFTTGRSIGGANAKYFADEHKIVIYKAKIAKKENGKISLNFDEDDLFHELIHHFDLKDIDTTSQQGKILSSGSGKGYNTKGGGVDQAAYFNNNWEVNAHFMEYVLPRMLEYLKGKETLPSSFSEFRNAITSDERFQTWYHELTDNNKKRILKRLGQYWTTILDNPKFNLEDENHKVNNEKLEKATYSFWNKVKDIIQLKEQRKQIKALIKEIAKKEIKNLL